MPGSTFNQLFRITTWGESHGKAIGVTIDGCPAGLSLSEEDIQPYLDRRRPGQSRYSTPRKETDTVELLSGVFEGRTTGTPISMLVYNKTQRFGDYREIASYYRPGHADFTFDAKYGFRDYRGGGRSSGRETTARVAAGAVAAKVLGELGVRVRAYTKAIGPVSIDDAKPDFKALDDNPLYMPDRRAAKEAAAFLDRCMAEQNSSGGVVECIIEGLPAGIGEPVFDKLDGCLAKAILSIGAVKGFEIGDGFAAAAATGLENNDSFFMEANGSPSKKTNHAGGVLGGISDGSPVIFRAAVKPTPSIAAPQQTVNRDGEDITVSIKGRHDPVIVPRAVVVVEAMAALTVLELMLMNMTSRLEGIKNFYDPKNGRK